MEQQSVVDLDIDGQIERLQIDDYNRFSDSDNLVYIYALVIGRYVILKIGSSCKSFRSRVKWMVDGDSKIAHLHTYQFVPLYLLKYETEDEALANETRLQALIANHKLFPKLKMKKKTEIWKFTEAWSVLSDVLDDEDGQGEVDFWHLKYLDVDIEKLVKWDLEARKENVDYAKKVKKKMKKGEDQFLYEILQEMYRPCVMRRALHGVSKARSIDIAKLVNEKDVGSLDEVQRLTSGIDDGTMDMICTSLFNYAMDLEACVIREFEDEGWYQ